MEPKKNPSGVFPHSKFKPSSIHISQQSQDSPTGSGMIVNLTAPLTPRIDISRASSSSMHEDSSPENVFEQVKESDFLSLSLSYTLLNKSLHIPRKITNQSFFPL